MPSQSRKHRGYATQRIVATYLQTHGWPYAHAIGAGEAGDDVQGVLDIQVEVKARRGFDPVAALRQLEARRVPGTVPFAVLRMDGTGETTIADWPAVIRFSELVALLRAAGYGDGQVGSDYQRGFREGYNDHARAAQHWQDTHGAYRQHGAGENP